MKNDLEHIQSPFLNEALVEGEAPRSWDPDSPRTAEAGFDHLADGSGDDLLSYEQRDDESVGELTDEFEDHECHAGCAHDRESHDDAGAMEFLADDDQEEAPRCAGEDAVSAPVAEYFDRETWSNSADQIGFRDRVLAAHIARTKSRRGNPQRDLDKGERAPVPGTGIEMRRDAAAAAGLLLSAAHVALRAAQLAGDADAKRTLRLTASSGYRARDHQHRLWLEYFPDYYKTTSAAREKLAGGAHSDAAVDYMLKPTGSGGFGLGGRIAAPGYSNHQNGIAIDLLQERADGHRIRNKSDKTNRRKWHDSWFHGWLRENAAGFGFKPIDTEEWHWEFRGGAPANTGTAPPVPAGVGSGAKPPAELTRFAQRVLNAVEGEKLSDDGDLGKLTRAALERFRRKYGVAAGNPISAQVELALVQRALEELAQASMFAQPGQRDARTEQELIRFKSARGLGFDATVDAATRKALTDALAARRGGTSGGTSGGTASPPRAPAPATPLGAAKPYLGGKLWTFRSGVGSTPVAMFCPPAALGLRDVEVLVFAHGLVTGCPKPRSLPDGFITDTPFRLGSIVAGSNRPIVLVLPLLDWGNPGGTAAFGKSHPRWHALARPDHLNALVAEAMAELGRVQSAAPPSVRNLVVAGHSRAYDFMEPLSHLHTDAQMQQGALARLSEVWSLDATYAGNVPKWQAWLAANPRLRATVFYRDRPATRTVGKNFWNVRGDRLAVEVVPEGHCEVPGKRLPGLLAGASTLQQELESEWEWVQHESLAGDPELELEGYRADDGWAGETVVEADDEAVIEADDETVIEADDETVIEADDEQAIEADDETVIEADDFVHAEAEDDAETEDEHADEESGDEAVVDVAEAEAGFFDGYAAAGDDEGAPDEEGEAFESEEEDFNAYALEDEDSQDKAPLAMPLHNPIPFAPLPPAGSYWPIRTKPGAKRVVPYMYEAPSGIVGRAGGIFLAGRISQGRGRWHVGVDLLSPRNTVVVAIEPGTIVAFSFFYKAKSGQNTYRLMIEHEGSGFVANYAELRSDSLSKNGLKVGMRVSAGQPIGFISDTDMVHFEAYVKGTTKTHRWWKSEKTPPAALLNPTRYLLELARNGLGSTASGGPSAPPPVPSGSPPPPTSRPPVSTASKPAAELVRFAQRVLNATEGEKLSDDGDLGKLTRAALTRFRQKYGLGSDGTLDDSTVIGLAQRALEELRQQSMFAQTGLLDDRTREELAAFRSQRGLGFDAKLDAATRVALTDALKRPRQGTPSGPTGGTLPKLPAPTSNTPSGRLPTLSGLGAGHTPPTDPTAYRTFRLTTYHVVNQDDEPTGSVRVPILDDKGNVIAHGSPSFFAKLSLEGTGRLSDGRLVNVTGKRIAASHADYAPVLEYHNRAYAKSNAKRAAQGKAPAPTTYSGIVTSGGRVTQALSFHVVPASKHGVGYGTARGVPYTPFRTLAADIGHTQYDKVDPTWKGKGGLVPPGTHVYIKEYDGLRLPDGTTHDGWFIVNDTGGAIFGAHFDVFTGTDALRKQLKLPAMGQVWFPGIEQRMDRNYVHGLTK